MQSSSIDQLYERLDVLRSQCANSPHPLDDENFEALGAALEQLRIAEEELLNQNAELTAARDALEKERRRYQDLFELAPDPYLLTNEHGLIVEANRATAVLFGVESRYLLGKPFQVFVPSDQRFEFRSRVRSASQGDGSNGWRLRVSRRDGTPVDVAVAVAPLYGRRGETNGLLWSLHEITRLVHDESRLRDLNAELERRVADRTAQLEAASGSKDKMIEHERQARDAAEGANAAKDEFLATLSHELRTPLNVILGLISRLRSGALDRDQQTKALETVDRNAREQARLIEDLLDTARISNGQMYLEKRVVAIDSILREAIDAIQPLAQAKGVVVEGRVAGDVVFDCDPERMRQIVWNLLTNAVKFTPLGGHVSVDMSADPVEVMIVVSDTGVGFESYVSAHIFERFWQAEPSRRRSQGGLGLGLSIVKHLIELHGGTIDATSPGSDKGATFTVHLPRQSPGIAAISAPAQ
jgi:PAS domain S-box-containing protein